MSTLPVGTVTFLFTDIEGSTRLLQTLRDEYADALAEHRALVRAAFACWNGVEVDTQGDSFFCAFARARDAVNAVVDAQRALSEHTFPQGAVIRVRMALHTGEPQVSDAHYIGMDVHRAARIGSAAHGGQVLLSQTTFDLVESELPDGVTLRDLGEHRLKDLRRPKHLYQLVIAGLQNDFPPIKTLDALPNNLPIQLTSFVGREKEIAELQKMLAQHKLVTLTGVGGTGKTRLALQVAANVLDDFHDGVWLIELAPLADPALVPQTVATALGLREQTGRAFIEMLQDYLRNKHLLLLLDNCEHLIEACAELADTLLHAAPHLKILATSREALGIAGETSYPVRSLSLPDARHLQIEKFSQYDAVRLFIDRAAAVQPNFQVTNENAPAVAQICARLDGIPLAIELAAARVKGLSVEQIAARLDDRFRLLTGGSRTALPRQRTLQAAIDWSYKLLSEEERVLLRRLSVFAGGWTVEAAEAVCEGEMERWRDGENKSLHHSHTPSLHRSDILDLLLRLVDKSLVVAETESSEPRYHMLETIRQYAQEKLDETGEANAIRTRHLEFFVSFAEQAEPHLKRVEQLEWLARLDIEIDNFRSAFAWSLQPEQLEKGLALAAMLLEYWIRRSNWHEGWTHLEKLLSQADASVKSLVHANALYAAAYMLDKLGDSHLRNEYCEQVIQVARAEPIHGKRLSAQVLGWYALVVEGDAPRVADDMQSEALIIAEQLDDVWLIGYLNAERGALMYWRAEFAEARKLFEKSLAQFKLCGDMRWVELVEFRISNTNFHEGDYARAREEIGTSLSTLKYDTSRDHRSGRLLMLGEIARLERNYSLARDYYNQALEISRELGEKPVVAILCGNLGFVELGEGNLDAARSLFDESLDIMQQLRYTSPIGGILIAFASLAAVQKKPELAVKLFAIGSLYPDIGVRGRGTPADVAENERYLSLARGQLTEQEFDISWNKGITLTLQQAIELARSGLDSG